MTRKIKTNEVSHVLQQLVIKQKNKCAICGKKFTSWDRAVLDHDHETGFIRGALHISCNGTEGKIKAVARRGHRGVSAYDYLRGLGAYLETHKKPNIALLHPTHKTDDEKRIERNKKARERRLKNKVK